jgi:hypothetical protein
MCISAKMISVETVSGITEGRDKGEPWSRRIQV